MDTLNKIQEILRIKDLSRSPVELPDFGRIDLAQLFCNLDYKVGVEVGVESGEYSDVLLRMNPDLILTSIDAWKAHKAYRDHVNQEKLDRFYNETKERLAGYGQRSNIVKAYSMEAVKSVPDRSLDFVYIDANHKFVEIANDIYFWSKKVKQGGIVAGHDFTKYKQLEVEIHPAYVVPAFVEAYQQKPYFVIGENVDKVKSWFYVQTQR